MQIVGMSPYRGQGSVLVANRIRIYSAAGSVLQGASSKAYDISDTKRFVESQNYYEMKPTSGLVQLTSESSFPTVRPRIIHRIVEEMEVRNLLCSLFRSQHLVRETRAPSGE